MDATLVAMPPRGPHDAVRWQRICPLLHLTPDLGVCALVADAQVALFRLSCSGAIYAVDNHDPASGANVMSRGIVGDIDGEPVVASPVYKQRYSLVDGHCLEPGGKPIRTHACRIRDGWVEVTASGRGAE